VSGAADSQFWTVGQSVVFASAVEEHCYMNFPFFLFEKKKMLYSFRFATIAVARKRNVLDMASRLSRLSEE
jgi:hypothetical protein